MSLKKLKKEKKKHHNETRLAFQKIIMKGDHNKDDHDGKKKMIHDILFSFFIYDL